MQSTTSNITIEPKDEQPLSVLIVDDEKGLRVGTKRLLEREGFIVETAENGEEGIKAGTANEFDIAIIDLKMPDVDGIEVLRKIREVHPNTICFIATAYASYETAIESTKLGAYSYIPKPFTPEEFLEHIRKGSDRRILLLEAEKLKREREERLLEVAFEKSRLNTIINSISDGLLVINKDGEAVLYNPSALKYLDLESIRLEEYIIDRLHPEIASLINRFLGKDGFEPKSYSVQTEINPNEKLFVEATCSPVPNIDGTLAGVVLVLKNISELKKVEMLKSQFVSMVSHELKAPVAAVYGFLKLFTDKSISLSEEQQQNYIKRSQVRLDGLLKMVNDLLDISRIELNTVRRELRSLELQEIIRFVLETFQLEIKEKDLSVELNVNSFLPQLTADHGEMTRLFTNLISNAIKYNRDNGKLIVNMETRDSYLVTEIIDSGIGMTDKEVDKLFTEFFRVKNEMTQNISGTGLGLSIVKKIVDAYAGKTEVESKPGEGTTFRVFLPFRTS